MFLFYYTVIFSQGICLCYTRLGFCCLQAFFLKIHIFVTFDHFDQYWYQVAAVETAPPYSRV